jgi:hypothetical protein
MGAKKWGRKKRSPASNSSSNSPSGSGFSGSHVQFGNNSFGSSSESPLSRKDSKSTMSSHRKSVSGVASSEQLVELMGARLCCLVEENTYFRDKALYYGSLGMLGRRGFSDARNGSGGDTRGTIWRPRVLVVTTTSVAMFGVKSGTSSSSNTNGTSPGKRT